MDTNAVIQRLWDLGHFFNKEYPTDVKESDLPNLKLTDKSVKLALASYQDLFKDELDRLATKHHGRDGMVDGEFGPATSELLAMERCG